MTTCLKYSCFLWFDVSNNYALNLSTASGSSNQLYSMLISALNSNNCLYFSTAMQKTNPAHRLKQEKLQAVIEVGAFSCWGLYVGESEKISDFCYTKLIFISQNFRSNSEFVIIFSVTTKKIQVTFAARILQFLGLICRTLSIFSIIVTEIAKFLFML